MLSLGGFQLVMLLPEARWEVVMPQLKQLSAAQVLLALLRVQGVLARHGLLVHCWRQQAEALLALVLELWKQLPAQSAVPALAAKQHAKALLALALQPWKQTPVQPTVPTLVAQQRAKALLTLTLQP